MRVFVGAVVAVILLCAAVTWAADEAATGEGEAVTPLKAAEAAAAQASDRLEGLSVPVRVVTIIVLAGLAHILVLLLRRVSERVMAAKLGASFATVRSVVSLVTSTLTFLLYFVAVGLLLSVLGVSLMAYLASASIMGLAIGFGSQGVVQDVVTGLTLIFSDLMDLGDMVELGGQTGVIRKIGMRFTVVETALGGTACIPNRTIGSVVNYSRGHVRCVMDVILPSGGDLARQATDSVKAVVAAAQEQFPAIILGGPTYDEGVRFGENKTALRVTIPVWPGRGAPLETSVKQEALQALKTIDPAYADWMVTVNYEVEGRSEKV
jgi:small-conductance mechanosensitive channel